MPPPSINDLDACQRVATMRRAGIPDALIAYELGLTVERLRVVCPDDGSDPLGLTRDRARSGVQPHRPRGHVGDPFAGISPPYIDGPPYTNADGSPLPQNGGAFGLLVLLWFFAG